MNRFTLSPVHLLAAWYLFPSATKASAPVAADALGCGDDSLGDAYLNLQQYSNAVAAFQEAIRLKPDKAAYRYGLGLTYATMGRKDEALQIYRTLTSMDSSRAEKLLQEINKSAK